MQDSGPRGPGLENPDLEHAEGPKLGTAVEFLENSVVLVSNPLM